MPQPYSEDLRSRVLAAVDSGDRVGEVAKFFKVCDKTLYLWRKQREERGTIKAITAFQKGHSHKITDLAAFKQFADENNGLTVKEMADKWGNVSPRTISRMLAKIGYTRKKRLMVIKKGMKRNVRNFKMQ